MTLRLTSGVHGIGSWVRVALVFAVLAAASPCARAERAWTQTTFSPMAPSPTARYDAGAAFDTVRGVAVVFGGFSGGRSAQTWTWNGTAWTQKEPLVAPTARMGTPMAFDSGRGVTVLFGGDASGRVGDTWEWTGADWTARGPTNSPSARYGHTLAYDSTRARTVLFGGNTGARAADTWEWNGTNWSEFTPLNPPAARFRAAMAYDAAHSRTVLFGGDTVNGVSNDTWQWDGTNWTRVTPTRSPSGRQGAAMTYDPVRQKVVLFGGYDWQNRRLSDTWEFDGANWNVVAAQLFPPGTDSACLVHDSNRGKLVFFGGQTASGASNQLWEMPSAQPANTPPELTVAPSPRVRPGSSVRMSVTATDVDGDGVTYTWRRAGGSGPEVTLDNTASASPGFAVTAAGTYAFDIVASDGKGGSVQRRTTVLAGTLGGERSWEPISATTPPAGRYAHSMAYDSVRQRTVLFGGYASGRQQDTWEWDGLLWRRIVMETAPSPRMNAAMAFSSTAGKLVLFGGDASGRSAETWIYDGAKWVEYVPSVSPPARHGHGMVFDSARNRTVLFGGDTGARAGDTWESGGGAWASVTTTNSPSARTRMAMAYDTQRAKTVLFGGDTITGVTSDTWEYNGTDWVRLQPPRSPAGRYDATMAYDPARQRVVLFGGYDWQNRRLSDTWEFDGNNWSWVPTPVFPAGLEEAGLVYDASRGRLVLFGGQSNVTATNQLWELPSERTTNNPPEVTLAPSLRAAPGTSVQLSAIATDADGDAISYAWRRAGGSGSEVTLDSSSIAAPRFTVPAVGTYVFDALASDGKGGSARATVTVLAGTLGGERSWEPIAATTPPASRYAASMTWDTVRQRTVLFGGYASGRQQDTWEWDGVQWRRLTLGTMPSQRMNAGLAYSSRGRAVLFGGDASGRSAETWVHDGVNWVEYAPATSPPARHSHGMVYDTVRRRTVVFGGDTGARANDTWEAIGGVWSRISTAVSPSERGRMAIAFDERRGRVVVFGGDTINGVANDTWEYDGGNWGRVTPARSPSGRHGAAMAYDAARQRVVLFGGYDWQNRRLNDTWEYDGANWSLVSVGVLPPGLEQASMVYDAARGRLVLFGGQTNTLVVNQLWELPSERTSNNPPELALASSVRTAPGQSVQLTAVATDLDRDPLTYTWQQLGAAAAPNLEGASSARPRFTPPQAGSYVFEVTVGDGRGASARGTVTVLAGSPVGLRSWEAVTLSTPPAARYGASMVYDGLRQRMVMFGGYASGRQQDTWEYDGVAWRRKTTANAPSPRMNAAMAYRWKIGRMVLFGGDASSRSAETWTYDGTSWIEYSPVSSPAARYGHGLVTDILRNRTVLFGGDTGTRASDTWEFDGANWTLQTPRTSPSARVRMAIVHDEGRGRTVVFGGDTVNGVGNDTWEWNGTDWVSVPTARSPSGRRDAAMAYDAARRKVVLFGGYDWQNRRLADTWEYDGANWTPVTLGAFPPGMEQVSMAYDAARGRMVLFGGQSNTNPSNQVWELPSERVSNNRPRVDAGTALVNLARTEALLRGLAFDEDGDPLTVLWRRTGGTAAALTLFNERTLSAKFVVPATGTYDLELAVSDGRAAAVTSSVTVFGVRSRPSPVRWSRPLDTGNPGARYGAAMAHATQLGYSLLFGGYRAGRQADTWVRDASGWRQLSPLAAPSPRMNATLAFDIRRQRAVLFGGDASSRAGDTWEWDGYNWVEIATRQSPSPRYDHAMAYDSVRGRTVVFGGDVGTRNGDTWEYDGITWQQRSPRLSPPARVRHAMAFDAGRGRIVVFGGTTSTGLSSETWVFDGENWSKVLAATVPEARESAMMAYEPARDRVLMFGGRDGQGLRGDLWEWDGIDWARLAAPNAPSAREEASLVADPARGRLVLFGGSGSLASLPDTHELEPDVTNARPVIQLAGFSNATAGQQVTLAAVVSDVDDDPLTYLWRQVGGPSVTLDTPAATSVRFTPQATAVYEFAFAVSDGRGGVAAVRTAVDTRPLGPIKPVQPSIEAIYPTTAPADALVKVNLIGHGFSGTTRVTLLDSRSTALSEIVVRSDEQISALLLPGTPPGSYGLSVTAAGGTTTSGLLRLRLVGAEAQPDLELTQLLLPAFLVQGTPASLQVRVTNRGAGEARPFNVGFGLIPAGGGTLTELARQSTETLAAGASRVVSAVCVVGSQVPPGVYLVQAFADPEGLLSEPGRANNAVRSTAGLELRAGSTTALRSLVPRIRVLARLGGGPQVIGLDGRESVSPDGGPLTYAWELISRPEGAAPFTSSRPADAYDARLLGDYAFRLTVSSGAASGSALAPVKIGAAGPVANAGPDRVLLLPDPAGAVSTAYTTPEVVLDGSRSFDPAGRPLSYRWSLLGAPLNSPLSAETALADPTGARTVLHFSDVVGGDGRLVMAGSYLFQLEVTSEAGLSAVDEVRIVATDPGALMPRANAGPDRKVAVRVLARLPRVVLAPTIPDPTLAPPANLSDAVRLDGRASRPAPGTAGALTYSWRVSRIPAGSAVDDSSLTGPDTPTPAFVPDRAGDYEFVLVVSDSRQESPPDPVRVQVSIAEDATGRREFNRPPFAIACALPEGAPPVSRPPSQLPIFVAGQDRVFLDGTLSADLDDGRSLTYLWTQEAGPSAQLAPSTTGSVVSFVPGLPGRYRFSLVVTDPKDARSAPAGVELLALPSGGAHPRLSLQATATTTTATGSGGLPGRSDGRALQVSLPTTVTLQAVATEGNQPTTRSLFFAWEQLTGPPVVLLAAPENTPTTGASLAAFTPVTAGVVEFQCSVSETPDATGGLDLRGVIRVAVDAPGRPVPRALAAVRVAPAKENSPCQAVTLDGTGSSGGGTAEPEFHWVQTGGPPVELSDPYSEVTTFVTPDLGDGEVQEYTFELYVDDGGLQSLPAAATVVVSGTASASGSVPLLPGVNLVGLPVRPTTSGQLDARWLADQTGASVVARMVLVEGSSQVRAEAYVPGLNEPFMLAGNEGYLVIRPGSATSLALVGQHWDVSQLRRSLPRGFSMVHYARGIPSGFTVADLLEEGSASLLVRAVAGENGAGKFSTVTGDGGGSLALEAGAGYLLLLPVAAEVRLSSPDDGCQ